MEGGGIVRGSFFVLGAAMLWAVDGLFRYPLLTQGLGAETIVFYEHLFLLGVFIPHLVKCRFAPLPPRSHWVNFFVLGFGGAALATVFYTRSFSLINPSAAILLQKLQPFFSIFLAHWLLKEPLSRKFFLWFFICLLGVVLIIFPDLSKGRQLWGGKNILLGYGYALLAAMAWGACTVLGKRLSLLGYRPTQIMLGRYFTAMIVLFPMVLFQDKGFSISGQSALTVFFMAGISGLLALFLYYRGLKGISARSCTLLELSFPFWAVILNWIFLDLPMAPLQVLGGLILLMGAFMVQAKRY